jgi:hypothetical protein
MMQNDAFLVVLKWLHTTRLSRCPRPQVAGLNIKASGPLTLTSDCSILQAKCKGIWIPDYDIRGLAPDNKLRPLSFILYQTRPECSMKIE